MHGHGMFFGMFWLVPLVGIGILLFGGLWAFKYVLGAGKQSFLPGKNSSKKPSGTIPKELKEAGQQILENLEWEIRFLEKQRIETEEPQEREEIEKLLRQKKQEYQATVDRLEL